MTFNQWDTFNDQGQLFPTEIKDRHGNLISIFYTYLPNYEVAIDRIVDTAGRVINFYYENVSRHQVFDLVFAHFSPMSGS